MNKVRFCITGGTIAVLLALAACGSDAPPEVCVAVDRSCTSAYDPTFDNLFHKTFSQSCALAGPSCHAAAGHEAGLVFEDADTAYRSLRKNGRQHRARLRGVEEIPRRPRRSRELRRLRKTAEDP